MNQGCGSMYKLNKNKKLNLDEGGVIWAKRVPYYDKPGLVHNKDTSMYVVVLRMNEAFLGCKLVSSNTSPKNSTVLSCKHYPLMYDSRIQECLYNIKDANTIGNKCFSIDLECLEYLKRKIYERIVINQIEGIPKYNDMFAEKYINTHQPKVNNIILYAIDKKFCQYLIKDMDDNKE